MSSSNSPPPPLLPLLILTLSTLAWPILEFLSIGGFAHGQESYSLRIESLSDLGVDYRQVHPLKHYTVTSFNSREQNVNFAQAGVSFLLAQVLLTRRGGAGGVLRLLLAVLHAAGMVLMATVHGGPREKVWGTIGWHWTGFVLAAGAGNLSAILAAVRGRGAVYSLPSLVLGVAGLFSLWSFSMLGKWKYETPVGLWQRGAIYPILAWNALTVVAGLMQRNGSGGKVKGKRI